MDEDGPSHRVAKSCAPRKQYGGAYDLFAKNCEHFASYVFTGRAVSNQVAAVGFIAAGAIILGLWGLE